MNDSEKNDQAFAIGEAIRSKRGGKSSLPEEIAALESSLLADIETFDLDAAVRRVCSVEVPIPYARHLELAALPSVERIVAAAEEAVGHG